MIEISFQYCPLLKLSVSHSFYEQQPAKDFNLLPTKECLALMKKLGFVFRKADREYVILFEPEKAESLISVLERKASVGLTFALYCSNPYFINYTDISNPDVSEIYYFSNFETKELKDHTLLHKQDFAEDHDRVKLVNGIELAAGESAKTFEIKDEKAKTVFKQELTTGQKVFIDNSKLPFGKYSLYEGKKHISSFAMYTEAPVQKPVALINISLDHLKKELLDELKQGSVPFYNYKAYFNNRNTYWKYYFISKYAGSLKHTSISGKETEGNFEGPKEVTLSNGKEAIEFISKDPMQLKERPDYRLQLRSTRGGNGNGKVVVENLPLASFEVIKPDSDKGKSKFFSEIIVYV